MKTKNVSRLCQSLPDVPDGPNCLQLRTTKSECRTPVDTIAVVQKGNIHRWDLGGGGEAGLGRWDLERQGYQLRVSGWMDPSQGSRPQRLSLPPSFNIPTCSGKRIWSCLCWEILVVRWRKENMWNVEWLCTPL